VPPMQDGTQRAVVWGMGGLLWALILVSYERQPFLEP